MSRNPFQRARAQNIDNVLKIIARSMPKGSNGAKLLAGLQMLGYTKAKAADYINVLFEAGKIEYDPATERWTIAE